MKRPPDTDFAQQRLKSRPAKFTNTHLAIVIVLIGIIFLPTGTKLLSNSNSVYESKITYDDGGSSSNCYIDNNNEGKTCKVEFTLDSDVDGPLYVYYQISNFFQNHRRYYKSLSIPQLMGENLAEGDVELNCNPLYMNASLLLNPCGLIANSFFNDVFSVDSAASTPTNLAMDETGIAVYSDRETLYKQVDGFESVEVDNINTATCVGVGLPADCKSYTDASTGQSYLFYYPDDDTVQYLYESYPEQISPIDGVTNEHFIVWMRTAALPTFRKLYGTIGGSFSQGDKIVFDITANFEVGSFDGTKSLILTDLGDLGGKNVCTGQFYITAGAFSIFLGSVMLLKELLF